MLVHGIMITNNADHHDPEHHAEMTASKIIVTAESASPETVRASRALRRDVERILLRHHEDTHHCELAALGEHGAARYDHPLHKDSAKTGHTTVCDTIMQDIVAAAHRHGLGRISTVPMCRLPSSAKFTTKPAARCTSIARAIGAPRLARPRSPPNPSQPSPSSARP